MTSPSTIDPTCDSRRPGWSPGWTAALAVGLVLLGAVATIKAVAKPFWFDELFTLTIAKLQSPAEILEALKVPIDVMPPPYYLICRAALPLASDEHVALRLPSLFGYLVAVACVYAFLACRVDRVSALAGAAFVSCTALADYAYEARPYALMTGSICVAACAWQRIDRSWLWSVALACSLGLAVSCHYYAIFAWPAFGFAELLVLLCERRFRARVWLALVIGLIPFVVCWPLLANFRRVFGNTWWSPPRFGLVLLAPQYLFKWSGGMWGPAVAAALAAMCIAWILQSLPFVKWPQSVQLPSRPLKPGECGLALGLLAIPLIAVVVARLTHGGLTERYMFPTIIGASLAIGAVTSTAPPVFRVLCLSIMIVSFGLAERPALVAWAKDNLRAARIEIRRSPEELLTPLGDDHGPIVMSDGLRYLQTVHYCSSDSTSRIVAIPEPSLAVALAPSKSDVIDRSLLLIPPYFPVHLSSYDDLLARHESFLLCSTEREHEWLPTKLLQDGHELSLVSRQAWGPVYRVTVKKP